MAPTFVPEIQFATVTSPWPTPGTGAIALAFDAAVAGTQPFVDVVNPPATGPAAFVGPGSAIPFGPITCFTPYVASTSLPQTPFASIGIVYANGTTCFPQILGPGCSWNPELIAVDLAADADGDGIPDGLEDYVSDLDPDPDCDADTDNCDGDANGDGSG